MLRTQLPTRAAAFAAAALLSLAAACGEAPSAPGAPIAPRPSAAVAQPTASFFAGDTVIYRATVGTSPSALVGGVTMRFADTSFVKDNSARDRNPAVGIIEAALPASASDRAQLALQLFEPYAAVDGERWGIPSENGVIDFGHFNVVVKPMLRIRFLSKYKAPAPGAAITLWYGNGSQSTVDGGANEPNFDGLGGALDGIVTTRISMAATVKVCETAPPPGYVLPKVTCQWIDLTWGQTGELTFLHDVGIKGRPPVSTF